MKLFFGRDFQLPFPLHQWPRLGLESWRDGIGLGVSLETVYRFLGNNNQCNAFWVGKKTSDKAQRGWEHLSGSRVGPGRESRRTPLGWSGVLPRALQLWNSPGGAGFKSKTVNFLSKRSWDLEISSSPLLPHSL